MTDTSLFRNALALLVFTAVISGADGRTAGAAALEGPALYNCQDPYQRLACAESDDHNKRFVCHATGAGGNPYVKLTVPRSSPAHMAGEAHGQHALADVAPGASGNDLGSGPGLDCDCNERVCLGACTGAPDGTACDDGDRCTGNGSCLGDACQPGAPSCVAGTPVDACTALSGACDPATGGCFAAPLPAGTTCEGSRLCDGAGRCVECLVAATCPGVDGDCGARTCANGVCGMAFTPAGTSCGVNLACNGAGACVGVPRVVVNEVESSGGAPGDWVELFNAGSAPADISGWRFLDNDDLHAAYVIPNGTVIPIGGFHLLEEAQFGFGLGAADSARLFNAQGVPVDSHVWASHAAITYGRCPNGTGAFTTTSSSTKGTTNACGVVGPPPGQRWPGRDNVTTVDNANVFGGNLSGLFHQPAAQQLPEVLWAVRNGPSTLFRLLWNGGVWSSDPANGWGAGKTLRYPGGGGAPDAEDVTKSELSSPAIYVVTERDNDASNVSRLSILRFDSDVAGPELTATNEWNLNGDLPLVGSNLGLESITWISDAFLVASSFFDEARGQPYNPASYPNHGSGLFFVGLEANGVIYVYALDHLGSAYSRVATITTGDGTSKASCFDRDTGYLWTECGPSCQNQHSVLAIDAVPLSPTFGRFKLLRQFARPSTMPNLANEGMAVAPDAQCSNGFKPIYWADDGNTGGHAIRADSIPCGRFIP